MDHLSSCYFCGVAVEAELRESPAITGDPPGLDLPPAEDRPTVTLCSACRNKLDRIVAGLGAATAGETAEGTGGEDPTDGAATVSEDATTAAPSDPAPDGDATAPGPADEGGEADGEEDGDEGAEVNEEGNSDDEDAVGIAPDAEIFGDTDAVPLDGDGKAGSDPESEDGDAAERSADDADGDGEPKRVYTASQAAGGRTTSSHGQGGDGDGGAAASDADGSDETGGAGGEDDGGSDTGGGADESSHGEEGEEAEEAGSDAGEAVPREAYNKVVRLLQNREFPVDRGDILTVASNAYGLDRGDCEAALDRLERQEVIEQEGDRLYRA